MSQIYCKYHTTTPARWVCRHCQIDYCNQCTPCPEGKQQPECPVCSKKLESLGAGNIIVPFWHRIPHFFIYPANLIPLLVILSLVAIDGLIGSSLFGFVLAIVFMKYAYVVLEQSAQGYLKPKPYEMSQLTEELELPFKQLFVIIIVYFVNLSVYDTLGEGMFFITMFLSVLSFPASVMVLAVEHSFISAFNPLIVFVTIKRIGLSYFVLCIFLTLLLTGSWIAMDLISGVLPDIITFQVVDFISMYFTLIMFHMMGYVIYQYHEDLGFDIEQEFDESDSAMPDSEFSRIPTREIDILIQEGKLDDANHRMQQQIKENPNDMALWQKYHKFLYVTKDQTNLKSYGAKHISRLLHEGKPSRAMQVFMDIRQVVDDFKPDNAPERYELAKLLAGNGQARLAMSLLNNLHVDFPSYADIPRAYFLVAKLLSEQFNDDSRAKNIIDFVIKKYPGHSEINAIKEYGDIIDKLSRH